ncbi:MAG: hypothetical protein A3A24_00565 [Candidatus Buchananbacteria bacterium RIFCSPLOWO2_01_FULL_46_12]|uniref:RNA polymerase sigma-70 region 4 domain-containing protein n=2 Tax=Candidatus Buchananiibacteriota TaxID=1817903 RepID=A0A1G1YND7_9BACT|nr:MAG: hypothetical protein A2744_03875 [Candidatus Buchananbacteria bacterium RIFCSPHIGHO2_01_FULL_44_11]OGY53811.1 MAG: hypothetical protein A3A24_00565 [Candidatus Buchananbacteria bacterium RIFCSPLOWO2_01_FULL_46_12]
MGKMPTGYKINRQLIIAMRLGLNGHQPYTLAAIGKKFNLSRQRIQQLLEKEGIAVKKLADDQTFFSGPKLIKQSWFPIKSLVTLRKLIDTGKIKAVNISTDPRLKRYHVNRQEVTRFLNAWDELEGDPAGVKSIKKDKNYFSCPALVKQLWFPVKSLVTLNKLIKQGKIKAIDLSTNPEFKRYYIHKDEAIRYVAAVLKEI